MSNLVITGNVLLKTNNKLNISHLEGWAIRCLLCLPKGLLNLITHSLMSGTSVRSSVQDCSNSIANALELLQSCTKPSVWSLQCCMCVILCYAELYYKETGRYIELNLKGAGVCCLCPSMRNRQMPLIIDCFQTMGSRAAIKCWDINGRISSWFDEIIDFSIKLMKRYISHH